MANRYYANLKRLMDLVRAALRVDDLPVVIGKISDSWNDEDGKVWDYGELVQYAQEKYARTDGNAAIVRNTPGTMATQIHGTTRVKITLTWARPLLILYTK